MKSLRLIPLLFFFLFFDFTSRAQLRSVDVPGYYITSKGDSVKGNWNFFVLSHINDSLILYKLHHKAKFKHADGKERKIRPRHGHREVGYWYQGKVRTWHRVHNRKVMKGQAPGGRFTFAPLMIDGKIEVHGMIRRAGLGRNDNNFETDHVFHRKGTRVRIVQSQFDKGRRKGKKLVKGCPQAREWFKTHDFILESELYTLVEFFNKNCP